MSEKAISGADAGAALEELLIKSRGTDIPVLLQAKELAKQAVRKDPSSSNLAALQRVTTMLDNAESVMNADKQEAKIFKNVGAVLRYLQEDRGRQIKKSKLYEDVRTGLLRKEDRAFRQGDVDRYAGSLPLSTTPDGRANGAEERMRRKDEAEIRIKEAQAVREEKKNAIIDGQYISKEQVYQELAARAVALNTGLKSEFRAGALDLVLALGGDQQKTEFLVREAERLIDAACNDYSREMQFEVDLHALSDEDDGDNEDNGEDPE